MDNIEVLWRGPHPWPFLGVQTVVEDFKQQGGIYLFTVEHSAGFLIYCAGYTTQPFRRRFKQHDELYRSGVYTIFDLEAFQRGERRKVWPGFWTRKRRAPSLVEDYETRGEEIKAATDRWLRGYRVFVAPLATTRRMLMRIEAAIMGSLYAAAPPACDMPDRGMSLSARWPSEEPVLVTNERIVPLLGLPENMVV
jgi:hypothetical protein